MSVNRHGKIYRNKLNIEHVLPGDAETSSAWRIETWIGFLSNDETNASDSVWTGKISLW